MFDVISGQDETASLQVNVSFAQDQMREDYIDLVAYGEHMYSLQPSEETDRSNCGKWDVRQSKRIRFFSSLHWKDMLSNHPEVERPLYFANANIDTCVINLRRRLMTYVKFLESDLGIIR